MAEIKGITLHRPWSAAIAYFGKDIENRGWACPIAIGSYLAIHAGSTWDDSAIEFITQHGKPNSDLNIDWESEYLEQYRDLSKGSIIAVAEFRGNLTGHPSPWFNGPIGWKLDNVVPIEPVYCRGQQKVWDIPEDVLAQIRINYGKSRKRSPVN